MHSSPLSLHYGSLELSRGRACIFLNALPYDHAMSLPYTSFFEDLYDKGEVSPQALTKNHF